MTNLATTDGGRIGFDSCSLHSVDSLPLTSWSFFLRVMSYSAHTSTSKSASVAARKPFLPPLFGQFASTTRDALRKKYQSGHTVSIAARSHYDILQEYGAHIDGPITAPAITGYISTSASTSSYDLTSVAYSDASIGDAMTATAKELAPGLKLSVTGATRDGGYGYSRPVGSLYTTFVTDGFNVSAKALTDLETHKLDVTAAAGVYNGLTDTITVGGQVLAKATDPTSPVLENVAVGAEYATADFVASLVSGNNLQTVSALYTHRIQGATLLATEFTVPIASLAQFTSSQRTLTVGAVHSLDAFTTVRTRVTVPSGTAQFHIERSLAGIAKGNVGVSLAATISKVGAAIVDQWGINLQLGEY